MREQLNLTCFEVKKNTKITMLYFALLWRNPGMCCHTGQRISKYKDKSASQEEHKTSRKQRNRQTNKRAASDGTSPAMREKSPSKTWLCLRRLWRLRHRTYIQRKGHRLPPAPHPEPPSTARDRDRSQGKASHGAVCPLPLRFGEQMSSNTKVLLKFKLGKNEEKQLFI